MKYRLLRRFQMSKIQKILADARFPHKNKHFEGFNDFICTFKCEKIKILWWQLPFEHRKSNKCFITRKKIFLVETTNFLYMKKCLRKIWFSWTAWFSFFEEKFTFCGEKCIISWRRIYNLAQEDLWFEKIWYTPG